MVARIYQPARSAMQSGEARTRNWVLEFAPDQPRALDPLMGWTGSGDMQSQVRLSFETKQAAIAYAQKHGVAYRVTEPKKRSHVVRAKGYGSNFAHDRRAAWTH
jgi:NADH dehydrogenase